MRLLDNLTYLLAYLLIYNKAQSSWVRGGITRLHLSSSSIRLTVCNCMFSLGLDPKSIRPYIQVSY